MVRGLDYYTKTTFEFVHDGLGAQSGIGGGGRYDGLMRQLGGQDLSGIGFGLGVDRTLLALRAEGKDVGPTARCDVFGAPLGEQAKLRLAVLAGQLRAAGVRVDLAYGDRGLKGAMRAADRSGARVALVAGDRDIDAGTIGIKDLTTGEQVDVADRCRCRRSAFAAARVTGCRRDRRQREKLREAGTLLSIWVQLLAGDSAGIALRLARCA